MNRNKFIVLIALLSIAVLSSTTYAQESDENYTVALLTFAGNEAFIDEMATLGYIEGENVTYMIPSFEGVAFEDFIESYNTQVQAMVDAGADIYVTNTDTDAVNVKTLVGDAPIVFARSDDPVATGAVASLVDPGANVTGIITNKPHERRLQILTEIDPTTETIYYLYSPFTLEAEPVLAQVQAVADELGIEVVSVQITDPASAVAALENTPEETDWFFLTPYVFFDPASSELLFTVSNEREAGIASVTDSPIPGYLIGYGPNIDDTNRQAARIVDRILRGASPADLPVQIAENYLLINLEAAEAINLEIPVEMLRQANTIIRPGFFDVPASSGN